MILAGLGPEGGKAGSPTGRDSMLMVGAANAQAVPTPKTSPQPVLQPSLSPPQISSRQWVGLQIGLGLAVVVVLWFGNVIRPSSLGGGAKGAGKGAESAGSAGKQPWWALMFAAIVIYLSMGLGSELARSMVRDRALPLTGEIALSTIKGDAIVLLAACGAGLIASGAMIALASGGLRRPTWRDLLTGVLAIVIAIPVVNATSLVALEIYKAFTHATPPTIGHNTLETIAHSTRDPWAWVQGACAILLTPIIEETMYRFLLQTAIVRAVGRAWLGIVLTSGVFAAAHIGAVPRETLGVVLPTLFVLGLALGIAMQRTGKLSVPIIMHALFNALNVALAVWGAG